MNIIKWPNIVIITTGLLCSCAINPNLNDLHPESEMAEIGTLLDKFVGYFNEDVKNGERLVLRVVPGGRVTAIIHGEEQEPIGSVTFSRVLWRIWLGDHSIVDRDRLVELVVED